MKDIYFGIHIRSKNNSDKESWENVRELIGDYVKRLMPNNETSVSDIMNFDKDQAVKKAEEFIRE